MNFGKLDFGRLVSWCECAGVDNTTPRGFHSDLIAGGWKQYAERVLYPEIEFLIRFTKRPRIILHNPYGTEGRGNAYRFDQRARCMIDQATTHISEGFRDEISKIVDLGVQVTAYVGRFTSEDGNDRAYFYNLEEPRRRAEAYWQVEDIEAAGCCIAFDESNFHPAKSLALDIMRGIKAPRKFVEPRQRKDAPHLFDYGVICSNELWKRSDPEKFEDSARWAAKNSQITGEIIRHVHTPPDHGWNDRFPGDVAARLVGAALAIQADGHSAAVAEGWLRKAP